MMSRLTKKKLITCIQPVRLIAFDVDGILTDGGMYYFENGDQAKKFNVRDGIAIEAFQKAGYITAILTGEDTPIVTFRAKKLKIPYVYLGVKDKLMIMQVLLKKLHLLWTQVAYVGDEVNDIELLQHAGFAISVHDAHDKVKKIADYICQTKGGDGVVREIYALFEKYRKLPLKSKGDNIG